MMSDEERLEGKEIGVEDGVEKRGIEVVKVKNDGKERRKRKNWGLVVGKVEDELLKVRLRKEIESMEELIGNEMRGIGIDKVERINNMEMINKVIDDVKGKIGNEMWKLMKSDGLRNGELKRNIIESLMNMREIEFLMKEENRGKRERKEILIKIDSEGEIEEKEIVLEIKKIRWEKLRIWREEKEGWENEEIVVIVGMEGIEKMDMRKRIERDRRGIGNNGGRKRDEMMRN